MRRPDLFIVGAPKCGTTALYRYLDDHPRIFMSPIKEPRFFSDDFFRPITDLDDYLALFGAADDRHLAIGEASPTYLRSCAALPRIREFSPEARAIVMVRNPVDLVSSYHSQQLLSLYEDEDDLERAWRLQETRQAGRCIPPLCRSPKVLQYTEVGRLGSQLEALLGLFDEDRVMVIVFDDFVTDTRRIYESVLAFLEVPSDGRVVFRRENPQRVSRVPALSLIARRPPQLLLSPYLKVKKRLGWGDLGFTKWLRSIGERPSRRRPLDAEFRLELVEEYRSEVVKLESILGRDLSHWKS